MGNNSSSKGEEEDEEFSDEDARMCIRQEKKGLYYSDTQARQGPSHNDYNPVAYTTLENSRPSYRSTQSLERHNTTTTRPDANLRFYQNKIKTKPYPGYTIKEILGWYGKHEKIEDRAYLILPWLFPTKNKSFMNDYAQPLQDHEAEAIKADQKLLERAQHAFNMMLEFFGMQPVLTGMGKFDVQRSPNWQKRYDHFNSFPENKYRITRMLSCMGEMGFNQYQCIWLRFLLAEVVTNKTIILYDNSTVNHWIYAIDDDIDKINMLEFYEQLKDMAGSGHVGPNMRLPDEYDGCDTDSSDETDQESSVAFQQKPHIYSFEQAVDTRFLLKTSNVKINDRKSVACNSVSPDVFEGCDTKFLGEMDKEPKEIDKEPIDVDDTQPSACHSVDLMDLHLASERQCIFVKGCSDREHSLSSMPNVQFYMNRRKAKPEPGVYLEELKSEQIDVTLMYKMHKYIQWLFPTPNESERNPEAVPLSEMEASVFENSKELQDKFIQVYRLLLACYGLDIDLNTGEILQTERWREMSCELNKCTPIPRIITRVLTSLGVVGFPHYQSPLLYFFMNEAIKVGSLPNLDRSCVNHWIAVIMNDEERQFILEAWRTLKQDQQKDIPTDWAIAELRFDKNKALKPVTEEKPVLRKVYGKGLQKEYEKDTSFRQDNGPHVEVESNWDISDSESNYCDTSASTSSAAKQESEHNGQKLHDFSRTTPVRVTHQQYTAAFQQNPRDYSFKEAVVTSSLLKSDDMSNSLHSDPSENGRLNIDQATVHVRQNANTLKLEPYQGGISLDQTDTEKVLEKEKKPGWKKRILSVLCSVGRSFSSNEDSNPYAREPRKLYANLEFYRNEKKSSIFWGHTLQEMLQWKGDYDRLEMNHQYIQWLFPIPEGSGVNFSAQALQPHEAEVFQDDPILQRRVLRAFEMMLDFYGMELVNEDSVEIQRTRNWVERYQHLNRSLHNHLRITRIIKSLGCLGHQKYQSPWVNFILHEVFVERTLPRLGGRQCLFWIDAIADEGERNQTYMIYLELKSNK